MASFISTRLIGQLASRRSIPPMGILIELTLDCDVCAICVIPSAISSGKPWNKFFVPHKIKTFLRLDMTGRLWTCYKSFWTLSPQIPQFKVFRGSRYFVQTLRYLFSAAAIESPIIVLKRFVIKLEQWLQWKFNQFVFDNLIGGIVIIMIYRRLF